MIASVIGNLLFNFWNLFFPGGTLIFEEWEHFCETMGGGMFLAAGVGVVILVIGAWFQRVPSTSEVFKIYRPHRWAKSGVWATMFIWYLVYLAFLAPSGKRGQFVNVGSFGIVITHALLAWLLYAIIAVVITDRCFHGRYRYVTWLRRQLQRRSA